MTRLTRGVASALLIAIIWLYVFLAPFTKVEESFNTQAVHDVLKFRGRIDRYDHQEFPGVVPRTFLGALAVAALSIPAYLLGTGFFGMTDLAGLYVSRCVLGLILAVSLGHLQRGVERMFGDAVGCVFVLLTALQFHLPYYASRLLPNTLATVVTNFALADWIEGPQSKRHLYLLTFAMVMSTSAVPAICFRCDILLLLIPVGLHLLMTRQLEILEAVAHGILATLMSLATTVIVDSWFWGRWLWPEGEVFYFNAILQKSVEWGAMPFHWYWTSALPRSLLIALPLALMAPFVERRVRPIVAVASTYVLLYSRLSHKEIRFLFPVLPLFNISAAVLIVRAWINRKKGPSWTLLFLGCVAGCVGSVAVTSVMTAASVKNYPGGDALIALHQRNNHSVIFQQKTCRQTDVVSVHIGTLPAMTGISRFLELDHCWRYSKQEDLTPEELSRSNFTYLISEISHISGYHTVQSFDGFDQLKVGWPSLLQLVTRPSVHILIKDSASSV